ncbi:hypothetical protein L211DRAFT_850797 [Terfezia boudieri ATCC MYA-4762]|uniref:NUDE domain-containing protein n=1 Tax=Terfezia boudieri ATCC MYA-4762 TaxID=1051890 RepID=A0A3N4LHP1_9PEZI|nr:hypothetical protein L211DRAFT_850797 [Terfezia boudieri ATCC MYA-4762]
MPSKDLDPDVAAELEFYKSQIATLESELADFQASSRELEAELEKELEASEKQHRTLKEKNEALRYEVDEWKTKYKQSKAEANSAQNTLQKEVTTLREQNRSIQLRLRDMEVSNDHFETQERIVKSSLEDLETKYNVSIERAVMLEADINAGEAEREALRIEVQRLRDELSDLRIEQEITHEKLQHALSMTSKYNRPGYQSPISEDSASVISDIVPATPRNRSQKSGSTGVTSPTPPSPPISETSTTASGSSRLPTLFDPSSTPRPTNYPRNRNGRGSSVGPSSTGIPIPQSKSLHQIRGLIGQMQRLEQRVQSARSKLPGPSVSPPRASPSPQQNYPFLAQNGSGRSSRGGRPGSSISTSSADTAGSSSTSYAPVSRLSFGMGDRPVNKTLSRMEVVEQLSGLNRLSGDPGRPSSRASVTTTTSVNSRSSLAGSAILSSLPQPKSTSKLTASPTRVAPSLAMSRHDYTTAMKTSTRSSLPAPNERKKNGMGHQHKDSNGSNKGNNGAGVTSDDDSDVFDTSPSTPGFVPPARRATSIGISGIAGYQGSPKVHATVAARSSLPRRSLGGDRRVPGAADEPGLMGPPTSIRKKVDSMNS